MYTNFALTYFKILEKLASTNQSEQLQEILNSKTILSLNQIQYLKSIPEIYNLFTLEQEFNSNPSNIDQFIQDFPYSRSTQLSQSGSSLPLTDLLSTFVQRFDTPTTSETASRESFDFSTRQENEFISNTNQDLSLTFSQQRTPQTIETTPIAPTEQPTDTLISATLSQTQPATLQEAKNERTQREAERQTRLQNRGVIQPQSQPTNQNITAQATSTTQSKPKTTPFQKAVYTSIAGSVAAGSTLTTYLTLFT